MNLKFVMWLILVIVSISTVCAGEKGKLYASGVNDAANTYIVVLKKGVKQASDIDGISARLSQNFGIKPERQIKIGTFRALVINTDRERVTALLNEEEIDYIEQDKPVKVFANKLSNCQDYPIDEFGQWGLVRINSKNTIDLKCAAYYPCRYADDNAYSYSDSDNGSNIYVYVLDSGVHIEHEEFGGRAEHGFVASSISQTPGDRFGHGTHVAGIAVGEKYGVAKAAKVISVKVLNDTGQGTLSSAAEGVEWVVNDILTNKRKGVCNLSFGVGLRVLEDAIESALSEGIPFVLAAGNDAMSACHETPAYLGKKTSAITVGATTAFDEFASFSNYGDCVNILAPGVYITSAGIASDTEHVVKSGTSMASPFVAGVVARLMSREPSSLTPWGIKHRLLDIATENAITMGYIPEIFDTPNKLLYFGCELPTTTTTTTAPTTTPTTTPITTPTTTPTTAPTTTPATAESISGSDITAMGPAFTTGLLNIIFVSTVIVAPLLQI